MTAIKPWYQVAQPHRDIREGRLDESVFAANLWQVREGNAPEVYTDAKKFCDMTFMTEGLKALLRRVEQGIERNGDAGDRIVSLQTGFGGGKTHALVALWHLGRQGSMLANMLPYAVREAIGFGGMRKPVPVAIFTNQSCDPQQGRDVGDGITVRTIWGDLAYQLGGKRLYDLVRPNDETRTTPKGLFGKVLAEAAPALILIDELADYCSAAAGVTVGSSTLDDQTISFVQELTEAVQQTPGIVLVATLPASPLEIANSEKGAHILTSLEKRMGRMGADVKPVSDDEIIEVIRRRLFEEVGTEAEQKKTVDAFLQLYQQHLDEVPPESLKADYETLMLRAYPFHPSLIQALHTRWGSHPDFQRTRGVLRLLAAIVGDLWNRRNAATQSQPLIQPAHLRFEIDALIGQVTRLYGANYQSVLASDLIGASSNAAKIDSERGGDYAQEGLASGLAAAIALGSFGGTAEHIGWSARDLKLATARPEVTWSYSDGALSALEERCFYLHATTEKAEKRYWFTAKPTLNKLVTQYVDSVATEEVVERLIEEIRDASIPEGPFRRVLVNPGRELPEQKALTLILLSPTRSWGGRALKTIEREVSELSAKCGKRERVFRNTLLFLAPSEEGLPPLMWSMRFLMSLERVRDDFRGQLESEQNEELKVRIASARADLQQSIADAYTVALRMEGSAFTALQMPLMRRGPYRRHFEALSRQLMDEGWLVESVGRLTLEKAGLWPTPEMPVNVAKATEAFLRFTDKPMLTAPKAVAIGFSELARRRQVGIAYGAEPSKLEGQATGETVAIDSTDEGLWIVDVGTVRRPETAGEPVGTGTATTTPASGSAGSMTSELPPAKDEKRYSTVHVTGRVPLESWQDVFPSFIRPLTQANADLVIRIDITGKARSGGAIPGRLVDQGGIQEAARQMKLDVDAKEG